MVPCRHAGFQDRYRISRPPFRAGVQALSKITSAREGPLPQWWRDLLHDGVRRRVGTARQHPVGSRLVVVASSLDLEASPRDFAELTKHRSRRKSKLLRRPSGRRTFPSRKRASKTLVFHTGGPSKLNLPVTQFRLPGTPIHALQRMAFPLCASHPAYRPARRLDR